MATQARLLKAVVQFTFVADDGGEFPEEVQLNPVTIRGRDWAAFCGGDWQRAQESLQRQLSEPNAAPDSSHFPSGPSAG